ncbi:LLM class flavin-dependent oxidoreductase [Nesterenkonia alkaliphila]|uniref:MsnO8 family LLM class oxidoreductase n=1 Tax=Nesterenkonia alkaliphila TaxID=1463631 RepID=A0A7K1ULT8_9MICC|nr:LLM class flavin-dependent oxidoreductase [Nesterenkonia alkaliphila]MVT27302.1 MsnO8 family LLM class oxidoreductase [Nesterenkonia alkaliphila]GFZ80911.1 alkanal monooxygenase [Nesterenkonia alkaliphila]
MTSTSLPPLSLLDLARVREGESIAEGIARSLRLAQTADGLGYERIWFAEHHNMPHVASSATSLLIQHIAAGTRNVRVGAGGIMLPNHSPLVIAEQFGTLETLFPGRIDLGLGRAPGTDAPTMRALRRDGSGLDQERADRFQSDIMELSGYLTGHSRIPGVNAYPGWGTNVPLYILGSSLFGAQLAARLGLPYAFASHFAPQMLEHAAHTYRESFSAEGSLLGPGAQPHFIAAANVIAHDDAATAGEQRRKAENGWIRTMLGRNKELSAEDVELLRDHPAGQQVLGMLSRTVAGDRAEVVRWLESFAEQVQADELILVNLAPDEDVQHRTLELLAPQEQDA